MWKHNIPAAEVLDDYANVEQETTLCPIAGDAPARIGCNGQRAQKERIINPQDQYVWPVQCGH